MSKFIKITTLTGEELILPMFDIVMQRLVVGTFWVIPKQELACEEPYWREISSEEYGAIIDEINRHT
jgi:hypothetical protein